jgi:hypothetical protein
VPIGYEAVQAEAVQAFCAAQLRSGLWQCASAEAQAPAGVFPGVPPAADAAGGLCFVQQGQDVRGEGVVGFRPVGEVKVDLPPVGGAASQSLAAGLVVDGDGVGQDRRF